MPPVLTNSYVAFAAQGSRKAGSVYPDSRRTRREMLRHYLEAFLLLPSTFLPVLIFLPAITSWFTVKLAHSGFALRAAPKAALGKNALFLGPTTVAERLVRACILLHLQLCRDQFGSTFASWKRRCIAPA